MKVILIKDVARLGRKGDLRDVPDGHAQNFLIPRMFAVIATQDSIRRVTEEAEKRGEHHEKSREAFMQACEMLKEKVVPYHIEANDQGHLFKGISARDIVKHLEATEHIILDEGVLHVDHPIKEVGTHAIPLAYDGIIGTCTLEVIKK